MIGVGEEWRVSDMENRPETVDERRWSAREHVCEESLYRGDDEESLHVPNNQIQPEGAKDGLRRLVRHWEDRRTDERRQRRGTESDEFRGDPAQDMDTALARDLKEMVLGVELTLVGGIVLLFGALTEISPLWGGGLVVAVFGFWVTVDSYANGTDPRRSVTDGDRTESTDE